MQHREAGKTRARSLDSVRDAMRAGNPAAAIALLIPVLQDTPTADAWLLAALLTPDPAAAAAHIRRGLELEPRHAGCRRLLQQLPVPDAPYTTRSVRNKTSNAVSRLGSGGLTMKGSRMAVLAVGAVLMLLMGAVTALLILSQPRVTTADSGAPGQTQRFHAHQVSAYFAASGLPFHHLDTVPSKVAGRQVVHIQFSDALSAQIIVYDTPAARRQDKARLAQLGDTNRILALANTLLVYPLELPKVSARRLVDTYLSLAG